MTRTVQFRVDPMFMLRQILEIAFSQRLKELDVRQLSSTGYIINVNTPEYVVFSVWDFLNSITDEELTDACSKLQPEGGEFEIAADDDFLFDYLQAALQSPRFKDILNENVVKHHGLTTATIDKASKKVYPSRHGHHYDCVIDILADHPELDNTDKQDDFVMNHVEFLGSFGDNSYYVPDFLVTRESREHSLHIDTWSVFEESLNECIEAYKQKSDTKLYELQIFDYDAEEVIYRKFTDYEKAIKFVAKYGLLDEIEIMNVEFYQQYSEDIQQAMRWSEPKSHDCDLTVFKTTSDTMLGERPDRLILKSNT